MQLFTSDIRALEKDHTLTRSELVALEDYKTELNSYQNYLRDRRIAMSMDRATHTDATLLEEAERLAASDRVLAQRLSQGHEVPPTSTTTVT